MLFECLIYIAVLVVVMELSYSAYWRCQDNAKALQQNAADILRALDAGERWRDDVRTARSVSFAGNSLALTRTIGAIDYYFDQNCVWRRDASSGRVIRVLSDVRLSKMEQDNRRNVTAWRWELELKPHKKSPRLLPLFTFEAVAANKP